MIELYDHTNSVCAQKVRLTLAEKRLEWTRHLMATDGDQFAPAYLKLNPNGVVPTLVHDGAVIIESTVICHYLDEAFPGTSLMPSDPLARTTVRMFAKLIDEYVHDSCTALSFATVFVHTYLQNMTAEKREAFIANKPNKKRAALMRDVLEGGLGSASVIDAMRNYDKLLKWISEAIASGPYLAGDSFSLADIMVVPYVFRLELLRLPQMIERWPGVSAWLSRVRGRSAFGVAVLDPMTERDHGRFAAPGSAPWPALAMILEREAGVRSA
jgi:glutathione S-transferase